MPYENTSLEKEDLIIGRHAPTWFTKRLYLPYLTGNPDAISTVHALGAVHARTLYENGDPFALRFKMYMPETFRQALLHESGQEAQTGLTELDAPEKIYGSLPVEKKIGLLYWLSHACRHDKALSLPIERDLNDVGLSPDLRDLFVFCKIAAHINQGNVSFQNTLKTIRPLLPPTAATLGGALTFGYVAYARARMDRNLKTCDSLFEAADRFVAKAAETRIPPDQQLLLKNRLDYWKAFYYERIGQPKEAAQLVKTALRRLGKIDSSRSPENLPFLESKVRLLERQYDLAVRMRDGLLQESAVKNKLRLDPYCIRGWMNRAEIEERKKDLPKAIESYVTASYLGPFGTSYALWKASACAKKLKWPAYAQNLLERAYRLSPEDDDIRGELKEWSHKKGNEHLKGVLKASSKTSDTDLSRNWYVRMYGPYLNLSTTSSPCYYAYIPSLAFDYFDRGVYPRLDLLRIMPPGFRVNLVREAGLPEMHVEDPRDLPARFQTARWKRLCEAIDALEGLPPLKQYGVLQVLFRVGLRNVIAKLFPPKTLDQLKTEDDFYIYHLRDMSQWAQSVGSEDLEVPELSFKMIDSPRCPIELKLKIHGLALVYYSRHYSDANLDDLRRWKESSLRCLEIFQKTSTFTPFEKALAHSRLLRAVCFVPFLEGDYKQMMAELNEAETIGIKLKDRNFWETYLKVENLHAIRESRSKSELKYGTYSKTHKDAVTVLNMDLYDPKSHIEMAESWLRMKKPEKAMQHYLKAASLGPVATEIGYHMFGEVVGKLYSKRLALDGWMQALRLDPFAVSAIENLIASGSPLRAPVADFYDRLKRWKEEQSNAKDENYVCFSGVLK